MFSRCNLWAVLLVTALSVSALRANEVTAGLQRYSFYTPDLHLISESNTGVYTDKPIAYEYIWFAGQPVAEVTTATATTNWTFTDHLGTPIRQTDTSGTITWSVEPDPYGNVYNQQSGATVHQPLRLPGQEAEQLTPPELINGATERSYNIFRWYRSGWGRYTQSDPIFDLFRKTPDPDLYAYVHNNPLRWVDPLGLAAASTIQCDGKGNYEVVNINKKCDAECSELHEKSHIADWQARYGADSCQNKPKGYLPLGGTGYPEFKKKSECKAYRVGWRCRLGLSRTRCCPDAKGGMQDDEFYLGLYCE